MIQKLRWKFVLINMMLVTLVLLIVFGSLVFFTAQKAESRSHEALRQAISHDQGMQPPKMEIGGRPEKLRPMEPTFCVTLGESQEILRVSAEDVSVSDKILKQAVNQALETDSRDGVLSKLNLRFLREETPDGTKIAFVDRSNELESLKNMLKVSALVGLCGLAAFLGISFFLSSWALRPVEQAWERQRQFVADASHELKTPLTVILANTGILLGHQEKTIRDQVKWVDYIQAEAERMKKLVDELLFLAKADAERTSVIDSRINFSDLVWSCLLPFESVAFEQGVSLDSQIESELYLEGNEAQLKQLVVILLDNACKYAGQNGTVMLELSKTHDRIRLSVNNSGEPISKEHVAHLFERFYRADESRTRAEGGYGLGLSIAQSIVKGHRGKMGVESTELAGTTFTVTLALS